MYCVLVMQYTRFFVLQFSSWVISAIYDVAAALTIFPCLTNGHMGHPLHLFMPGRFLFGLEGGKGGL